MIAVGMDFSPNIYRRGGDGTLYCVTIHTITVLLNNNIKGFRCRRQFLVKTYSGIVALVVRVAVMR